MGMVKEHSGRKDDKRRVVRPMKPKILGEHEKLGKGKTGRFGRYNTKDLEMKKEESLRRANKERRQKEEEEQERRQKEEEEQERRQKEEERREKEERNVGRGALGLTSVVPVHTPESDLALD